MYPYVPWPGIGKDCNVQRSAIVAPDIGHIEAQMA